ncbi:MAG: DUF885 domain-containing protein [Acidimicrobiia bacterium]|nr:DUF885 domain-containing protein [Acidimicrobiia bacterium]
MPDTIAGLADEYWQYKLRQSPATAHLLGYHEYDADFDEASREAEARHVAALRDFASRAEALNTAGMTRDERVSREVLLYETTVGADHAESPLAEFDVNHEVGFQTMLPVIVTQFPVLNAEHAADMVRKYRVIGLRIDEMTERFREGRAAGRVAPKLMIERTAEAITSYLGTDPAADRLLNVQVPDDVDEQQFKGELRDAVTDAIRPAMERQRALLLDLVDEGRPNEAVGISNVPGGEDMYRRAVKWHTSTDLTPDEVHQIGLDTIASLNDEYRTLGSEVLGTDDLEQIYSQLRDDPELHFDDGETIRQASEAAMGKAKAAMGDWFGRLPRADCLVKETPTGPLAFYQRPASDGSRPGTFYINTADPTRWGKFEIEAMSYHEGIPGHHLQLAISGELTDIPEFRKHARITAYAEGWGLYTERLADEMGLYSTPLDRIGMLSADSMRAARLVVDTGMHAKGWSRQRAIDYVLENSPLASGTVTGEIDRYIGMPGQALSYMIGRKEIQRIRRDAEQTMGDRFDIKGFHDTVLGSGLLPLPLLARLVREWAVAA